MARPQRSVKARRAPRRSAPPRPDDRSAAGEEDPGSALDAAAAAEVVGADLPLPHERDQAIGSVSTQTDPVIEQAHADIEAGQVDTDMRATPGLDAENRARLLRRGRR